MKCSRLKFDQIYILVKKDFKLKYDSTALGMLWSIVTPLLMSAVYWFVFGRMMKWGDGTYALYIVTGNFVWHYFSSVVQQNGGVLMANAALIKKTSFDRRLLIWATYVSETLHFLLTIPVMFGLMLVFHIVPSPLTFFVNIIAAGVALMYFSMGISYVYAAANLFFRDSQRIISVFMRMWLYASPVFIPVSRIPKEYMGIYEKNPMTQILITWRDAFYQPAFHPERFPQMLAIAFAVFLVGRLVFRSQEPKFAEMM